MSQSSSIPFDTVRPLWMSDMQHEAEAQVSWLWQGYLAPGNLTLLTSQWKAGKTTLLTLLLDRMKSGGELAGLRVLPGKAAILSEESPTHWLQRGKRFDLNGHVCWFCRPFVVQPRQPQWQALLDQLLKLHEQVGLSLVAIDPLASFFPAGSENDASNMIAALLPLQRLTSAGLAILLAHHPRKKASIEGQSARGSGALCGHADILLEMHCYDPADGDNRRRRLLAWSRHEESPRHRLMELSEDGREYLVITETDFEELLPMREVLWKVLKSATTKRTRAQLVENWPPDEPKPAPATLARLLKGCVDRGELLRDGEGLRNDPFRYWLPELEQLWETDVVARIQQNVADARREVLSKIVQFD